MCKKCKAETEVEVEILKSGPHYSKIICKICKAFIKFGKNPVNIEFDKILNVFFNHLVTKKVKSTFILSLMNQYMDTKKLSPKQIECLKNNKEYIMFMKECGSINTLNQMKEVVEKAKSDKFITDLDEEFSKLQLLMQQ